MPLFVESFGGGPSIVALISCPGSQVGDEHVRKQHRSLAELHYSKAVRLFLSLRDAPCELLRTLLERVAFAEFTMAGRGQRSKVEEVALLQ